MMRLEQRVAVGSAGPKCFNYSRGRLCGCCIVQQPRLACPHQQLQRRLVMVRWTRLAVAVSLLQPAADMALCIKVISCTLMQQPAACKLLACLVVGCKLCAHGLHLLLLLPPPCILLSRFHLLRSLGTTGQVRVLQLHCSERGAALSSSTHAAGCMAAAFEVLFCSISRLMYILPASPLAAAALPAVSLLPSAQLRYLYLRARIFVLTCAVCATAPAAAVCRVPVCA
jgi:hypothetical protein